MKLSLATYLSFPLAIISKYFPLLINVSSKQTVQRFKRSSCLTFEKQCTILLLYIVRWQNVIFNSRQKLNCGFFWSRLRFKKQHENESSLYKESLFTTFYNKIVFFNNIALFFIKWRESLDCGFYAFTCYRYLDKIIKGR